MGGYVLIDLLKDLSLGHACGYSLILRARAALTWWLRSPLM